MAEDVLRALWAFIFASIVVLAISLLTKPRPVSELEGLVYGGSELPEEEPVPFYKNEYIWAVIVVIIFAALDVLLLVAREEGVKTYAWFRNSHLVFHRSAAADLWPNDFRLRRV